MKLHILSDLHNEFQVFEPPQTDADMVLLAGDIWTKDKGIRWAGVFEKPVLYINGNHEHYRTCINRAVDMDELIRENENLDVTLMDCTQVIKDDVRFLGCTLWTDFDVQNDRNFAKWHARQRMDDYRLIRVAPLFRKLHPDDTEQIHWDNRQWLEHMIREPFEGKTVVMTHHAPSPKSILKRFEGDVLSACYASDLEYLMDKVDIWIHGHTHSHLDYMVGDCRVVCNPRGYAGYEMNHGFKPDFVIDTAELGLLGGVLDGVDLNEPLKEEDELA